jgi:hypothetical protein
MAADLRRSKSQPVLNPRPYSQRASTRNTQPSRTHRKSLKTLTGELCYPERPVSRQFSLQIHCQRYSEGALPLAIAPQPRRIARRLFAVLTLFPHALRRQARPIYPRKRSD